MPFPDSGKAGYPPDKENLLEVYGSGKKVYDDNLFNDIYYVLNKDVLLNYVLRPLADPDPTDLSNVYASWWTEDCNPHNY